MQVLKFFRQVNKGSYLLKPMGSKSVRGCGDCLVDTLASLTRKLRSLGGIATSAAAAAGLSSNPPCDNNGDGMAAARPSDQRRHTKGNSLGGESLNDDDTDDDEEEGEEETEEKLSAQVLHDCGRRFVTGNSTRRPKYLSLADSQQ